jgi:hypothetical protein
MSRDTLFSALTEPAMGERKLMLVYIDNTLTCAGQVSVGADIFPYIRKLIPVFAVFAVYMDRRTDLLNHQSQHSGWANQTRRASDSGAEHCPP